MAMPHGRFGGNGDGNGAGGNDYGSGSPSYIKHGYQDSNSAFQSAGYGPAPQTSYGPAGGGYGGPAASYNQGPPAAGGFDGQAGLSSSNHMNDVFFAAACCIVVGSFIGGFCALLQPVDFLEFTYLMMFGLILAVLDTPWIRTIKVVGDSQMYVAKYIQFVTRVTGKGITLIFLGSALFMAMWDNLEGGFLMFLAVVLCLFPVLVGFCSVIIGLLKSSKLEKARSNLSLIIDSVYDEYAGTFRGPHGGLTMEEFNNLTVEKGGGLRFETLDLKLIFNALVSNPMWKAQAKMVGHGHGQYQGLADELRISKEDIMQWCNSRGMVFL